MVDFRKLMEDSYAALPEQGKRRVDAWRAREAQAQETEEPILATFEQIEWALPETTMRRPAVMLPNRSDQRRASVPKVIKTWDRWISVRIEDKDDGTGVIRFVGGPTGYEAFELSPSLYAKLQLDAEKPDASWYICAGTPGEWHGCKVKVADILAYLIRQQKFIPAPAAAAQPSI